MPFQEKLAGRLLLIEDCTHLRRLLTVVLGRLGVAVVSTCTEALDQSFLDAHYDVVLVEPHQKGGKCSEALPWLRSHKPDLTRAVMSVNRPVCIDADESFLTKPFTLSELKDFLRPFLTTA